MTRRREFLKSHPDFHPGMLAFSDDGRELGEVQKLDEDDLTIEKGRFFSADRRLPYDAVADIRDDHLIINRSRADLEEWSTPDYTGLQESRRADVEEPQTSVPIYQKDLEEHERTERDVRTGTPPTKGPPDVERAGPMPGGESFREEKMKKRPVAREEPQVRREDVKVEPDRPQQKK